MTRKGFVVGGVRVLLMSMLACADATTGLDPYNEFGSDINAGGTS